jgi:hypothetical protein
MRCRAPPPPSYALTQTFVRLVPTHSVRIPPVRVRLVRAVWCAVVAPL